MARPQSIDLTAAPRAVLRESVRLAFLFLGEERLGNARTNAWQAICADRERAQGRAQLGRALADATRDAGA